MPTRTMGVGGLRAELADPRGGDVVEAGAIDEREGEDESVRLVVTQRAELRVLSCPAVSQRPRLMVLSPYGTFTA